MIIIGAKGFAKEVFEILLQQNQSNALYFYDDISDDLPRKLYDKYLIISKIEEVIKIFETVDNKFALGIGNPILRRKLYDKFTGIGGKVQSTISSYSDIASSNVEIGEGSNVLSGSVFSNGSSVGKSCIVYYNTVITHDCKVGDFVEISPSVTLLGNCIVGSYTQIGANATVLPKINIGENVIVGAGAVVTKDVPDNCLVVGVPAVIKRKLNPLNF